MGRLAFSRTNGEVFVIGKDVFVTIIEARNGIARIVVEAPPEVEVNRLEVAIQKGIVQPPADVTKSGR